MWTIHIKDHEIHTSTIDEGMMPILVDIPEQDVHTKEQVLQPVIIPPERALASKEIKSQSNNKILKSTISESPMANVS